MAMAAPAVLSLRHDEVEQRMPRLPVPQLEETLKKYLRTLKPFATPEELARNEKLAEDFLKSEQGKRLQQKLLQRAKTEKYSWLEEWWFNWAYYDYRDPVPINVTYKMRFVNNLTRPKMAQVERAALLCEGFMWLKNLIESQTFREKFPVDSPPLCMATHRYIFHSCRIPHPTRDYPEYYSEKEVSNIVVLRKGQFYTFEAYHQDGTPLTAREYEAQLLRVIEAEQKETVRLPPLGVLTTENRTTWANARTNLMQYQVNVETLKTIQKCAFVLCLDDVSPKSDEEASYRLLLAGHNEMYNRFYDKGIQLIVFNDGTAGLAGEHSRMDGQPLGMALDMVLEREGKLTNDFFAAPKATSITLPAPALLRWKIDEKIYSDMAHAIRQSHKAISNVDFRLLQFKSYGKNLLKRYKVSPDAIFQISLQLAYYRLYGKIAATYESASTRQYARGRTEVGRSANVDAVAFFKAMDDAKIPSEEKFGLFSKAASSHVTYVREAVKGYGVDRHLLAMRLLTWEEGSEMHPLFKDPLFSRSSYWQLSTSQLDLKTAIGFGPVVPDGYGVCYLFSKEMITITITAFKDAKVTSASKLQEALQQSLNDVFNLVKAHTKLEPSAKL